jgi:aminoglycoside phosphotransferase (APT) family kinase protein
MGALFRADARETDDGPIGAAHGDFAPWNMLRTESGWVLIDWEAATDAAPPFFDACHFLVQSHSLLGRPSMDELVRGFGQGEGWIGSALHSYADGAGLTGVDPERSLVSYLEVTEGSVRVQRKSEARGLHARRALLARLAG